jgi:putative membrane protein
MAIKLRLFSSFEKKIRMEIFWFKTFHIIGFVTWFGGLFYLGRIFVYHIEALSKEEPAKSVLVEQFKLMEQRVYKIIANAGMMITFTFGTLMLVFQPAYLQSPWIHIKLLFVILLLLYHLKCKQMMKQFANDSFKWKSFQLRLWNEVPSFFLVIIVILAVFRDQTNYLYLAIGMVLFSAMIFYFARAYKNRRETSDSRRQT